MAAAVEYFHDHVRIEHLLFDGVLEPRAGVLVPDQGRAGLGRTLRTTDAEAFRRGLARALAVLAQVSM